MKRFLDLILLLVFLSGCQPTPSYKAESAPQLSVDRLKNQFCKVYDDPTGITRVQTSAEPSYWACFGAIHATHRSFQMDYYRRTVQGRLAEIFGKDQIAADFRMRVMGLYEKAESLYSQLDPQTKDNLWAYAIGVNKFFQNQSLTSQVHEFKELDYQPEPWHPRDSIAILLLQSFDQTRKTFVSELEEADWIKWIKAEAPISNYDDDTTPWFTTVLKSGEYDTGTKETSKTAAPSRADTSEALSFFNQIRNIGIGSNNWVIDKNKSASGHAILANDPHLHLQNPAVWYHINLETGGLNVMGASFPGMPVIASGLNQMMAWGLTNSYYDHGQIASVSEDELLKVKTERPTIWFKWAGIQLPFIFKTYRKTESGLPVLPVETTKGRALVLNWAGYKIQPFQIRYVISFLKAKNIETGIELMSGAAIPSWNVVFADSAGDIALITTGLGVKNPNSPHRGVKEMRLSEIEDLEFLTPTEMPKLLRPKRGFIATANNKTYPDNAKFKSGYAARNSLRAFRIEEQIQSKSKISPKDAHDLMCDLMNVEARFLLHFLLPLIPNDTPSEVVTTLSNWDFSTNLKCQACALYRRWTDLLSERWNVNEAALWHTLNSMSENKKTEATESFRLAMQQLVQTYGTAIPEWGNVHRIKFDHLSKQSPFLLDQSLPSTGDEHSVSPGTASYHDGYYYQTAGASHRLLVEMSTPPKVMMALAGTNQTASRPDFDTPESAWLKWRDCQIQSVQFPFDWGQYKSETIHF